jgi:hypothetical protein
MKIVIEGEELAIRKSKKDRQLPKDNRTNNDLQNTTQKTKNRATRIPLKPGVTSSLIFIHVVLLIDILE